MESIERDSEGNVCGFLEKWTNYVTGWQFRWFVLVAEEKETPMIKYYTNKHHASINGIKPRGVFHLNEINMVIEEVDGSTTIGLTWKCRNSGTSSTAYLRAMTQNETYRWVDAINNVSKAKNSTVPKKRFSIDQSIKSVEYCKNIQDTLKILNNLEKNFNEMNEKDIQSNIKKCIYSLNDVLLDEQEEETFYDSLDGFETEKLNLDDNDDDDSSDCDSDVSNGTNEGETSQKSVIIHLLSQLRIGMDLTKVTLPAFILERRSLLETYADFFSHPDIFSSIAQQETPRERMMMVVKYFLSSFHAGRKPIAKKPYNPVLGETFRCQWNLESQGLGTLKFIAEQVSHHPSISAFYVENKSLGISCQAQIWTKSKFLGTSVECELVGHAIINLPAHNEQYRITFPSIYARSILTIPWMELGGVCALVCENTGFHASVNFRTKPFFGGKKNRVETQVFHKSSVEPVCHINGFWNGSMFIKAQKNDTEKLYIETREMPIIKKQVRPLNEQTEFESRNLWKNVSSSLKKQKVGEATKFKHEIEQRQRNDRAYRERNAIIWKQKIFFKNEENNWQIYEEKKN